MVEQGHVTPETQEVLDQPLVDPAVYSRMANAYWDSVVVSPPSPPVRGGRKGGVEAAPGGDEPGTRLPPPTSRDTVRDLIAGMAMVFNPEAAGDLGVLMQLDAMFGSET